MLETIEILNISLQKIFQILRHEECKQYALCARALIYVYFNDT